MSKTLYIFAFSICFFLLNMSLKVIETNNEITLSYTTKYNGDSWENNRTGLVWCLSMLGAELPKGSFDKSIEWKNKTTFKLKLNSLGFSTKALKALSTICDSVKKSDIYTKTKSIDIGYFIAITLGSSWHYYKITEAPDTYKDFLESHQYASKEVFPVLHSTVSKKHRFIKSNFDGNIIETAFIAEEGIGKITDSNFVAKEFNVMDVMKNGQLRFIVYDSSGLLNAAADEYYGISGKPAKCLWCHEVNVQTVFEPTDSVPSYLGPVTFDRNVKLYNELLMQYRLRLNSDIDFTKKQAHTQTELIYINYMEPSLESLSQAWKISVPKLKKLLKNYKTHIYPEFPFLGNLYYRDSIYPASVYKPGQLPSSIRNSGTSEPNFFQTK